MKQIYYVTVSVNYISSEIPNMTSKSIFAFISKIPKIKTLKDLNNLRDSLKEDIIKNNPEISSIQDIILLSLIELEDDGEETTE